ncbi:HlyD family type I secretion periplasmic adaptor subunit [Paraburkholderia azotifigens]|jgi:epimerase transport system membrane fusion protein|uniref:HlyD family type I secretion periplasmic adaptor subunit n=1 Tax=Paraburkholderia azotifigens TaxID=2057004 RepID=UPI00208A2A88|nr:HlyD family type I secretion periplasmic adaptor subunit [Paraburkholderia hospita]
MKFRFHVQSLVAYLQSTLTSTSISSAADDRLRLPGNVIALGCLSVVLGIGALSLWAAVAPLSGAVVAEGMVRDEGERKTIQHQEGGIVHAIFVKDGDHVKVGQVLVSLDNVRPNAELNALQSQLDDNEAKSARLLAERDLQKSVAFPSSLVSRQSDSIVAALLRRERTLFDSERRTLEDQVSLLQQQIAQTREEIGTEAALIGTSAQSLRLAKQELDMNQPLRSEGYVTETKMMELRRTAADYESRQQSDTAELIRSRQRLTDLTLKVVALRNDYVKSADAQLKDTNEKILQLTEQLRPAQDVDARTRVMAPVAGEVVALRVHTIGAAIGPREPILDLVPIGAPLIIEAKIKPDNVREIVVGGSAEIRLTAYNPRSSPTLRGKVAYLSADSLGDKDTHQQFYLARIEITPEELAHSNRLARDSIVLSPGLRADVFIKTKTRTAFDYMLAPVWDGIQKSMRD